MSEDEHREQVTANQSIVVAKEDAQDNDESLPSQVDVKSFYYLEVRLEHSAPLSNWRFRVVFTDLSVVSRPSVTVDNVPVNAENCLLFTTPNDRGTVVITTYFDSVTHFPHIRKPRELYGHCIRILVHSISPVQRVVIDTLVHFLVEPSTDHPMPPTPETPTPNLDTLQIAVPRPLAAVESDYTGWQSDDDEQQSLRTEQECTTVDRKKTELKQMRARMKHKMQQEQRLLQSPHRR
ncbi:hypothetical protein Poli38472_000135 [Pythium oligandrum]|uniref:Uncharacterized protein n=1 Tax=Pythium oligandrum TaxID=41045 RepID=A0A8K1CBS2_PYTOL|nr:hypothetical protein Poli38472_000135 [Pythium oligandrum]|eukprot:TMW60093.1 hypothetical protein Poli38472_000135 [Pythium oligandrum]